MNTPQTKAGGKKPSKKTFPTLLALLRDLRYYHLVRALLNGDIQKMLIAGPQHFTYRVEGDEVVANDEDLAVVVGSIKAAIGFKRLRLSAQRFPNIGLEVLSVSSAAKKALLLELIANLAHLSSADLVNLPHPLDIQLALLTDEAARENLMQSNLQPAGANV